MTNIYTVQVEYLRNMFAADSGKQSFCISVKNLLNNTI